MKKYFLSFIMLVSTQIIMSTVCVGWGFNKTIDLDACYDCDIGEIPISNIPIKLEGDKVRLKYYPIELTFKGGLEAEQYEISATSMVPLSFYKVWQEGSRFVRSFSVDNNIYKISAPGKYNKLVVRIDISYEAPSISRADYNDPANTIKIKVRSTQCIKRRKEIKRAYDQAKTLCGTVCVSICSVAILTILSVAS